MLLHSKKAVQVLFKAIRDKVFKNGRSKICDREPLQKLKGYGLLKPSTNFTWFILEYFVSYATVTSRKKSEN